MCTLAPILSFHDHSLFDEYRQGLENVADIGTGDRVAIATKQQHHSVSSSSSPPPHHKMTPEEEMEFDELIKFDPIHWGNTDPTLKERQEQHLSAIEQQQKEQHQLQSKQDLYAKEYALLRQLEDEENLPRLYDYTTEDIIVEADAQCEWLLENDININVMNNTNALARRNFEFELLCQDKRGAKIVALHDRFVEIALRADVSEAQFDALIAQTHKIAQNPAKDQFLLKCSEPKKRGRTSDADRLKTHNVIDALRKDYITAKKAGDTTTPNDEIVLTDKYRVFLSLLRLFHDNAQTRDNYGLYLEKMNRLIAYVDRENIEWPMRDLMRSILNMEACIGIDEIEIGEDANENAYYCSYSGERIKPGDSVYHIRILEYSHDRHKKWRIIKDRPIREFESPEFMNDVHVFFVKRHFVSLTGLWFRDFDEAYKTHHKAYFEKETHGGGDGSHQSPQKRQRKSSSLVYKQTTSRITLDTEGHVWQRMKYMRDYINEHNLGHKAVRGKTFAAEVQRIHTLLDDIVDSHTLQINLCEIISAYYTGDKEDDEACMAHLNRLMFVVLNFIDLFYRVAPYEDGTDRPLTEIDTKVVVLRLLLDLSQQRRAHPSYTTLDNEFERINREVTDLNHYTEFSENNFLFLSLFDYLFPAPPIVKKENGAHEVLSMFGL